MKSYFSRFLHHTLSHSDVKHQSTSMLSYSGLTRISRWNKFATLFNLDTPVKPECDSMGANAATCRGRSMVEMLGVLAIIGVLSVGAIAGYSKAMFKYKLNKQTSQIGYILDYIIANQDQLRQLPYFMKNALNKLGVVPNEMVKDNSCYAYDVFNFQILLENHSASTGSGYALGIEISNNNQASGICRNLITMAKARADDISWVYIQRGETNGNISNLAGYYGNKAIGASNYLRDMDMTKIDNACKVCDESTFCELFLLIGYSVG